MIKKIYPYSSLADHTTLYKEHKFKSGEWHFQLSKDLKGPLGLCYRLTSWDDVGHLVTFVDSLKRIGCTDITLFCPYFPGGRQDRVANAGEPFTAKVYADIINSLEFTKVQILYPHSDVTAALLNNCEILYPNFHTIVDDTDAIIIPDAGATKKIESFDLGKPLVQCLKTRDTTTGKLSGFECYGDVANKDVMIIDDICQGGGTFLGLYDVLIEKGAKSVSLFVAHGFFDNGIEPFEKFKRIISTNSVSDRLSQKNYQCINIWHWR